jgi:hypothetical protein
MPFETRLLIESSSESSAHVGLGRNQRQGEGRVLQRLDRVLAVGHQPPEVVSSFE